MLEDKNVHVATRSGRGVLEMEPLVAEARARTGLDDFGPDTWQEGLQVLIKSLNEEAAMNARGLELNAQRVVEQLIERLKFERSWKDHPQIADEQIVSPLVGVGLGRTGSNALGFVMFQDPRRRMLRMWELLYPSPPPEKATEHTDPRIAATQVWLDDFYKDFPDHKDMVPVAAEGPNECCYLLAFDFRSQIHEVWGRAPSYHKWLFACDMTPAYEYHKRVLQMLQWRCGPKNWFIRSPPHMHAMKELNRVYPDARFVQTHRNVDAMIPSEAALFSSMVTCLTDEPDEPYLGRHLANVRVECLKRLMAFRDDGNEHRFFDIGFYDMQADPMGQIRKLYAWLGEDLPDDIATRMEAWWDANSRERQGARKYVPETYGVTAEELRQRFAFYHERYPALTGGPRT